MLDPFIEAGQLRELLIKREIRPREVAEFFLRRIERLNPKLGAYMTVTAERAVEDASRIEKLSPAQTESMALFGVPYSIKDITWTKGIRTTLGSRSYEDFVPQADAEVVTRLSRAGGILLGKTTTPEFGSRPTTEGGLCPPARNPWNLERTAGGSSGGAACAVASGLGPIAEGTDGGGSIRVPAACCGVVGLKPSRGRVSYAPVMGEGWAGCVTIGPIARSVRDVAIMLDVIAGPVVGDPYCAPPPAKPFAAAVPDRPKGLKIAAISESVLSPVEAETLAAFEEGCRVFRAMGHRMEPIKCDLSRIVEAFQTVAICGIASYKVDNLELVEPVARAILREGRKISAPDYIDAVARMHNIAREIIQELAPYDAILTPTLTRPAVPLGTLPNRDKPTIIDALGREWPDVYGWMAFTLPFNATGQPAISMPNGFTKSGLPIGLQIVGRPNDEPTIIALAAAFEEARPFKREHPPLDSSPAA
jgi:amidase